MSKVLRSNTLFVIFAINLKRCAVASLCSPGRSLRLSGVKASGKPESMLQILVISAWCQCHPDTTMDAQTQK